MAVQSASFAIMSISRSKRQSLANTIQTLRSLETDLHNYILLGEDDKVNETTKRLLFIYGYFASEVMMILVRPDELK